MNAAEKLIGAMQYLARETGVKAPSVFSHSMDDPWAVIKSILKMMGYAFYQGDYDPEVGLQASFADFLAIDTAAHQVALAEVLATVCDVMGTHPECGGSDDAMTVVLLALSDKERWRYCLKPGHDPHALARNLLLTTAIVREHQNASRNISEEWLGIRLRLSEQELLDRGYWKVKEDAVERMTCAMFGEHWWLFYGQGDADYAGFDANLVTQQRPEFKTGLVPAAPLTDNVLLPDLHHG